MKRLVRGYLGTLEIEKKYIPRPRKELIKNSLGFILSNASIIGLIIALFNIVGLI